MFVGRPWLPMLEDCKSPAWPLFNFERGYDSDYAERDCGRKAGEPHAVALRAKCSRSYGQFLSGRGWRPNFCAREWTGGVLLE